MDGFQQENRLAVSSDDQREFDRNTGRWPNNSFHDNAYTKDGSQETNHESYSAYDVRGNVESQDMFNMHDRDNLPGPMEDNGSVDLEDSNVVTGIYEIGRDYLQVEQEIQQKHNDIRLLQEDAKLLKTEIEDKQRILETSKVELLTEQDNYDDILKKLNDEITLITAIGVQQEALNNLAKNLFKQKLTVEQLIESFNTEFYQVKLDGNKIMDMYNKKILELKKELEEISNLKSETEQKRKAFMNERLYIIEKLKVKINEMEIMQEKLKVKYYQKIAILDYLKIKGNEELSKCANFESELKLMEENECQQSNLEENAYFSLQEKEKSINDELCEIKQKNTTDRTYLEDLINMKNDFHEQIGRLLQEESTHLENTEYINKSLLTLTAEANHLEETVGSKELTNEENFKLKEFLNSLETDKNDTLKKECEIDNLILAIKEKCSDLDNNLKEVQNKKLLIIDNKNNLASKKLNVLEQLEQIKIENNMNLHDLINQKSLFNAEQEVLESRVTEYENEIKSNSNIVASQSVEALRIKEQLQNNSEEVVKLQTEIKLRSNDIAVKQDQHRVNISAVKKRIEEKKIILADAEAEINERLKTQSDIECLKGEMQVIDCQARDELRTMQEECESELQTKQKELENKKKELEEMYVEKKKKVTELQEEIVDEQKNELYLVKSIQKLTFISDKNKRELVTMKNVVKTLDEKLSTIAITVANSMKDKESIIQSQSTIISTGMAPPNNQKTTLKKQAYNYDSSSSGVSMHDNDTTWKKRLNLKQYRKQTNTQTNSSKNSQLTATQIVPVTSDSQKIENKNVVQTEYQNKATDQSKNKKAVERKTTKKLNKQNT